MTRSTESAPGTLESSNAGEGSSPDVASSAVGHRARAVSARLSGQLDSAVQAFADVLFANSDLHAVSQLSDVELVDLVTSAHEFVVSRPADTHKIRSRALPTSDAQSSGLVIEILNDDMPFLVDSIVGELRAHQVDVDLLLHPVVAVRHGSDGNRVVSHPNGPAAEGGTTNESLMIVVARHLSTAQANEIEAALDDVLKLVRHAVVDWQAMLKVFGAAVAEFSDNKAVDHGLANSEVVEFCHWLLVGNFTFLGLRQYNLEGDTETGRLVPDMSSALGVLRDPSLQVLSQSGEELELTPESRRYVFADEPLIMTKSDVLSRIHRRSYMDYIGLKTYDENGRQVGELRLVGLLTSNAYTERPSAIPLLRRKVEDVVKQMGISSGSHDGKALLNVLENFPRDELFRIDNAILMKWARAILDLRLLRLTQFGVKEVTDELEELAAKIK